MTVDSAQQKMFGESIRIFIFLYLYKQPYFIFKKNWYFLLMINYNCKNISNYIGTTLQ